MSKSRQLIEKLLQEPFTIQGEYLQQHEKLVDSIFSRLGVIKKKKLCDIVQNGKTIKMVYYLVEFPSKEIAKQAIEECPPDSSREKYFVLGSRRED